MNHHSTKLFKFLATIFAVSLLMSSASVAYAMPDNVAQTKTPIQHLIVLLQENHTFDNYFGTYPGADGLTADIKMPVDPTDPSNTAFVVPYHIGNSSISDLSHSSTTFDDQFRDGKMDGFVYALNKRKQNGKIAMGYYNGQDLPYYWNLADQYVLFDRFFSSARTGSFSNHMFWVAGVPPESESIRKPGEKEKYIKTIFDELNAKGISWKFYIQNYDPNITYRDIGSNGNRASQVVWAPILNFDRFIDDPNLNQHIVDLSQYYEDLKNGTLPEVAYIAPSGASEHPPGSIQTGQRFVKTLIQELMRSEFWNSSAFLLAYDDWGGWFDHVVPPQVDASGYGLRVPALLVSPYARQGYIDHTQLDFTSILKFIEQNWGLPALAERDSNANNILSAFDFNQPPRKPIFVSAVRQTQEERKAPPTQIIYSAYGAALFTALLIISLAVYQTVKTGRQTSTSKQHSL